MMESKDPRASPGGPISQDEGNLWMKINSNSPVMDHTDEPCGQRPGDETKFVPCVPALITRYVSVMDDEGADDVFIPPPPSYMDPLLPDEGSTDATANYSGLTLTNGAADATEAEANPSGLDWHHAEKQLMAEQSEVDKVIASTPSEEWKNDSNLPKDQDQTSMEEICYLSGRQHQENATGDGESKLEHEDIAMLSERQEKWREMEAEKDKYPKQIPSSIDEKFENELHFDKEGDQTQSEEMCDVHCDDEESDEDFEPYGPPGLSKCNRNTTDAATNQPQVPEIPPQVSNGDKVHVVTSSLNYTVTKHDWVRRESDTSETQVSRLSVSEGDKEMPTMEEQEDGSSRIATDIQQGEQLLQRLQRLQLQQDGCSPESPHNSQKAEQETRGETKCAFGTKADDLQAREADLTCGDEREESRSHTAKTNLMEKNGKNESQDVEANARMSSSTMSVELEHQPIARDSDDHFHPLIKTLASGSWVPADLSLIDTHANEMSMERQIHKEVQGKQNLQKASGVLNQADNPDVLEIPFKTNILLEPLPTKDGPPGDWQFSEQKMKKEISQDIQRELVLVNQGKIPGGYSKGEVRQLKETKLLFEAFQQDNTEGPKRQRKPRAALKKGRVYPSVLERTHSLEMLSFKSCPLSRAQSLRQYNETEKTPEILRSMSPTGGSRRVKTRYTKQDKLVYRSMDSIKTDVSASAGETRRRSRDENATQESPILQRNPFFNLRPALALKPEVEKDIREAKEREEELRRQRCDLYGENTQSGEDGEKSRFKAMFAPGARKQSSGKLERVWPPPPSMKDQMKSEQTQQESKVQRAAGQKSPLWQRWEAGLINGEGKEKN